MLVMISVSKINRLGNNLLYILSTIGMVLYQFNFDGWFYACCFLIITGDILALTSSDFFKDINIFEYGPSAVMQSMKLLFILLCFIAGSEHPSYMLLTNTVSKTKEFSRESASEFLSYRFLSDEQKKSFYSSNKIRIGVLNLSTGRLKKKIENLTKYKASMKEIVDKELGSDKETNKLLLEDVKIRLEENQKKLKVLEKELTYLRSKNEF